MHNWLNDPSLADDLFELERFGPLGKPPTRKDLEALHPDLLVKPARRCTRCKEPGHPAARCPERHGKKDVA